MRPRLARLMLTLIAVTALAPLVAYAQAAPCDLDRIKSARELHDVLSRRSIEIVARASKADWKTDARLAQVVAPDATFDLGAGDVGRPLGAGPAGAHALSATMRADQYGLAGLDFMDSPTEGCAKRQVTVEFIDSANGLRSKVEFFYVAGRLAEAKGWQISYSSGSLGAFLDKLVTTR